MKTTPWYPGSVKPVRVGLYEQKHYSVDCIEMYYWNGSVWELPTLPVECNDQNRPWRGLIDAAIDRARQSGEEGK
jgi:hypothetical protein